MSSTNGSAGILPREGGAERLRAIAGRLAGKKVAVIGDLVADVYVFGKPERVSREAPVLIVAHEREEVVPGGAGNTLQNLSALGAEAFPIGTLGKDEDGKKLRVDTTVVQTDIHHPTDNTLLWDVVRVVTRLVGQLATALERRRFKGFRDRTRAARRRLAPVAC